MSNLHPIPAGAPVEQRIVSLDGLRGLMTILVVVSHYFGEVPHGISAVMFGWMAVDMFFVLSGYLVGKMILEKMHHDNFFLVFYVRRVCRTLPIYFVCIALVGILLAVISAPWADADVKFPIWSYFTFTQNFFMVANNELGAHWLEPTWTLAVEEHFYLIVPALFFFVPRRRLVAVLLAIAGASVLSRLATCLLMDNPQLASVVLIHNRADILIAGLLAAIAIKNENVPWARIDPWLPITTIVLMMTICLLKIVDGPDMVAFSTLSPLVAATACATFLLSLVRGAPYVKRFSSKFLRFFNDTSYAVYLTHLPVLGLMHGLLLGARPDIATPAQWAVTIASMPVCVAVSWLLTKLVEQPITAYGRTWAWSGRSRHGAADAISSVPARGTASQPFG